MEIYGLGIVGICMFAGSFIGRALAGLLGVNGDVGGVGFAMVFMIAAFAVMEKKGKSLAPKTQDGIKFLGALYIPVVVAMSANQNVVVALKSGIVPIAAGVLAIIGSLLMVPLISKMGNSSSKEK